jgi:nicotinate-nucleotide pyrophosphorylase (carboxylating)
MPEIHPLQLGPIIDRALEEDWGHGDWTTDIAVPKTSCAKAHLICKERTVVAGLEIARAVFLRVDPSLVLTNKCASGSNIPAGTSMLEITGKSRSILKAERVALNFLSRMCGIAYKTRQFAERLEGKKTQLLDTRKTTPGLRLLEKSATVIGGARNHRLCLTDGVLIKENHIRAAGSITKAVGRLLESLPPTLKIEVETTNLDEVHEAIDAGADLILLDNMSIPEMTLAVRTVRGRALLEASGEVTLDNLEAIAATGVDFVSSGAIIHGAKWANLSLLFIETTDSEDASL